MKLSDSDMNYLLAAADASESVDAMESFSNGVEGHYHFIKYSLVQKKSRWSGSLYDIAIALHVEQWNFGLDDGE